MYPLGQGLEVSLSDAGEDGAPEGLGLEPAIGDEIGDEERVLDGEGDVASEDLIVVLQRRGAKHLDAVALQHSQHSIHLVDDVRLAGEAAELYCLVALGIVSLLEGGDGPYAIGETEDDGLESSRLVRHVWKYTFHNS